MVWKQITAGLLAICIGAPLAASSFDVLQQSRNVFYDTNGNGGAIRGRTSLWDNGRQRDLHLRSGGLQLKHRPSGSSGAYTDFMAFCVEITATLQTSPRSDLTYTESTSVLNPLRQTLVATLYQEVYDPVGSVAHQGAFQLALWKLAHGDVSQPAGDGFDIRATSSLSPGVLSFALKANGSNQPRSFDYFTPGTFDLAQSWLDNLNGTSGGWSLNGAVSDYVTFLTNGTSQDLVTAAFNRGPSPAPAPIPLPPAALLSGAGVVALLMVRRISRRR